MLHCCKALFFTYRVTNMFNFKFRWEEGEERDASQKGSGSLGHFYVFFLAWKCNEMT